MTEVPDDYRQRCPAEGFYRMASNPLGVRHVASFAV
jgi:hypothetical protein